MAAPPDATGDEDKAVAPKDDNHFYLTGFKLFSVLAAVTLVCFLILLDMSIIVTALPKITDHFHSLEDLGWYGSAYQLASASLQPLTGRIYHNFKSKWTFLAFFFVFELGSLLCAIATSSNMLIIARAVAGLGSSGLMNGSLTIITSSVPLQKSPIYVGIMMGCSQMGIVFGPLLGGAFTEYVSWRWCFYINLPIGAVVAAIIIFTRIPDQADKPPPLSVVRVLHKKLDLLGFALFAPAAIQLLLALQYGGNQYAWNSSTVIGLFCGAGATFILFCVWEYRQGDMAMIPFSMLRKRPVWSSCLTMFCIFAMVLCAAYYVPVYFQAIKNTSPMMSGVYMLPSILAQMLFAVMSGVLTGKLGYYLPWTLFCGVASSIGNGLVSTWSPHTSTARWVGYQILLGAGRGAGMQTPFIAVQNTLPREQISIAMAILMFTQTFSGAIFLTFADVIFDNSLKTLIPQYAPSANSEAIIAAGATAFREVVSEDALEGVLVAYAKSIDRVFYMAAAVGAASFFTAWGMGWKDIRKKKPSPEKV
ncbi:hypothetical protein ASPZODRAFT_56036 [Penicilliopsis zonata CBS 506.65]|uniref:Major facilitator superfamily (MFS) profile domain-containing protein n=1 Tax=Penicilliopsis zonata CBS 506.65 TaxID=1073090 RepID=A0A1L9SUH2_9EURO|nr:hypothetical protein ASPZODRAFT_56036 [Penicilliopsis zonata CBS 506.65]OJJ50764.1 hypothetical protein ASPZODRAFT_56036 [Penicilliopsis zonata CBS 506.65]